MSTDDIIKSWKSDPNHKGTHTCDGRCAILARLENSEAERDFYLKKLLNIRNLPERSSKCECFNIAKKALRSHDEAWRKSKGE